LRLKVWIVSIFGKGRQIRLVWAAFHRVFRRSGADSFEKRLISAVRRYPGTAPAHYHFRSPPLGTFCGPDSRCGLSYHALVWNRVISSIRPIDHRDYMEAVGFGTGRISFRRQSVKTVSACSRLVAAASIGSARPLVPTLFSLASLAGQIRNGFFSRPKSATGCLWRRRPNRQRL